MSSAYTRAHDHARYTYMDNFIPNKILYTTDEFLSQQYNIMTYSLTFLYIMHHMMLTN